MDVPKPPIRGKYSIRNPAINALFSGMDMLLSVALPRRKILPPEPQRILISNIAHLGDVIMATALLPVIKSAYPEAQIGFLVGSWSKSILQDHPLVDHVHFLDHWAHNRASISRRQKWQQYLRTRREALRQIRAVGYDAAFDLYWNFPNTLPLLWQAEIPMRVGYGSGGFGPLATQALEFGDMRLHASQRFLDLVKTLPRIKSVLDEAAPLTPSLPPGEQDGGAAAIEAALRAAGVQGREFLIFHVGAADSFRDWPAGRWRELAELFLVQGHLLVFTGSGPKDALRIQETLSGLSGCVNLCDRLPWSGFVAAVARTRLLVCVDTVAGHVAAATATPCVVITAGRWPYLWRPLGPGNRVLMHPVPCAPCHRNSGCDGMECIQEVSVSSVYEEAAGLLSSNSLRSSLAAVVASNSDRE
jgi:ADP-heptose:LPS heptosyltransferase